MAASTKPRSPSRKPVSASQPAANEEPQTLPPVKREPPSDPGQDGVEDEGNQDGVESDGNDEVRPKDPYDPDLIRVDARVYSVRQILDMIKDQELDLAPDFQRELVWDDRRKARLIESILLRIPLPAFYFDADKQGRLSVIDGIQRLSAVRDFVDGKYALQSLEYLRHLENKKFAELEPVWTRRVQGTQIIANVIDPQTPAPVKFDIFRRINTGGQALNTQELRHCIAKTRSRQLLRAWAQKPSFLEATQHTLKDHKRMKDREAVLRFIAFRLAWPDITKIYGPTTLLDDFLTAAMKRVDDEKAIPTDRLAVLEQDFERGMENALLLFGSHAFRKWPLGEDRTAPLNMALLESWAVTLADYPREQLAPHVEPIVAKVRLAMRDDRDYFIAVTRSTSNQGAVKKRFALAQEVLTECVR